MGHKIKTLVAIKDEQKGEAVPEGVIVDFGVVRNKKAVDSKWAEWHIVKETEKKESAPKTKKNETK